MFEFKRCQTLYFVNYKQKVDNIKTKKNDLKLAVFITNFLQI